MKRKSWLGLLTNQNPMASAPSAQQPPQQPPEANDVCRQLSKLLAPLIKRLSALEEHASSPLPTPTKPAPKPAPKPSPKPSPKSERVVVVDASSTRSRTPEDVKETRERYRHDVLTLTDACWLAPRYGSRLVVQNRFHGKAVDSYSFDKALLVSFTKAMLREHDVPYNVKELRRMHNFLRARRGYHLRTWRRVGTHANMYCGGTLGVEPVRLVEILQQQTELEQREKTLEAQRLEELKAKNKNKNKEAANTDVVVQAKNKNKEAANTDVVQEVAPSMPAKKKKTAGLPDRRRQQY